MPSLDFTAGAAEVSTFLSSISVTYTILFTKNSAIRATCAHGPVLCLGPERSQKAKPVFDSASFREETLPWAIISALKSLMRG